MGASEWELRFPLRDWQQTALGRWQENGNRGVAAVVTGGGKTMFAFACMARIHSASPDTTFVIVVPTVALADQWVVGLTEDLGVPAADIALTGGGARAGRPKRVNVMVVNSARRQAPAIASSGPTMLVVDECHRAASEKNSQALAGPHVATLGLSATPERDWDNLFDEVIKPALGPVIYEYGYNEARRDEVISPFNLVNVEVAMTAPEQQEYDRLTKKVITALRRKDKGQDIEDQLERLLRQRARVSAKVRARLPMAVRLVEQHRMDRAIVFHEDINAANILCELLLSRGHRAAVYHSALGVSVRHDNLRMFRAGEIDVLVTCRALDEGINVPDARLAVIAASTASTRQRVQRLGRVLRPAPGKGLATVYTIYAAKPEEDRLRAEAEQLEGAESVKWLREAD